MWLAVRTCFVLAALVLAAPTVSAEGPETPKHAFVFDPAQSTIDFDVTHLGLSLMKGRFKDFQGRLEIDPRNPEQATVEVTVLTASVDTAQWMVDGHLRSPDFFDVERHPTMVFKSSVVEVTGNRTGRVQGTITLIGITRPLVLDVTLSPLTEATGETPKTAQFSAAGTLTRSEFGMDWGPDWFAQDVEISIQIEAQRL